MDKIIIVLEATNFSINEFEFIRQSNLQRACFFKAYFLIPEEQPQLCAIDRKAVNQNVNLFELLCKKSNIDCKIYREYGKSALASVIIESRFADLIIINVRSFDISEDKIPYSYISNILHHSECPVFLLPRNLNIPLKIVFLFDELGSSLSAIKWFCYLFPEMNNMTATLIYDCDNVSDICNRELLESVIKLYFINLEVKEIKVRSTIHYYDFAQEDKFLLLVAGAGGRSEISEILKSSFLSEALWQHKIPLFIAHPPIN